MKTIKTLFLFVGILVSSAVSAQEYVKHATTNVADGTATLYYKVSENGVRFKLENNTSKTLYCKIVEVTANWTDGKTRTKSIYIKWIPAGEERSEIYWQTDNYSTMKGWSFDSWRVSEKLEDLD
jgi:hypothetical protein